jgi:hypothetical protein
MILSKIVVSLAISSLAALALYYLIERDDEARLEREAAGQLDALREHLFKR